MKKTLAFVLAATAFGGVWAQSPPAVGSIQNVQGLVTISQDQTLRNAVSGSALTNGARVVSTTTGSGEIVLANGCRITLAANRAVTINTALPCNDLIASVTPIGPVIASTAPATTSAAADARFLGVVGTGAVAIILMNQRFSGS